MVSVSQESLATSDPSKSIDLKVLHWNILANKLADAFDKVPRDYLKWSYRFNLIKQHLLSVDADVVGLSEVDVMPLY